MANQYFPYFLPCLFAAFPAASAQELPFRLVTGNLAVVEGTVAGGVRLAMLIDTGASTTVIDPRAVKHLRLDYLQQTVEYGALEQTGRAHLAVVRDLRVGPIATSLACVVGQIPVYGVDMVLGLNVLKHHSFEIDYERRKLVFGPCSIPSEPIPFESGTAMVVIKARAGGGTIRMLVDTGAATHCVFDEGPHLWLPQSEGRMTRTPHMNGGLSSREVILKALSIGSAEWKEMKAMLVDGTRPALWDAVLGTGSLGLKRIHFDFERRLLSWIR